MSRRSSASAPVDPATCKGPDLLVPRIDRNRCEGKEDCVRVCPYDVFTMGKLAPEQRVGMSLMGRMKAFAHGYRQAFVAHPDRCHACGACVTACPEQAITLARPEPGAST
jgi:NAD-dependent dihydropyrimidine dehydrogenase PreA subunit